MSLDDLNSFLVKHYVKIVKKENFFIDNPPQKLHESVSSVLASLPQPQKPLPLKSAIPIQSTFPINNSINLPNIASENRVINSIKFPSHINVVPI